MCSKINAIGRIFVLCMYFAYPNILILNWRGYFENELVGLG
jgi:hypothetical protein